MKQQICQFDNDYVREELEDDYLKIPTQDNSNPQQGASGFPQISSSSTNVKDCNATRTPVGKPSRLKVTQPGEDLMIKSSSRSVQGTDQSDITKNSINNGKKHNSKAVTQLKIPPYKRDSRKLFVGGLPAGLNGDEFRSIFEKFGTILDSVVIIDRTTKRSRGFGFVTFEDPMVAHKVLHHGKRNTHTNGTGLSGTIIIRGKRCEIKASQPKEMGSSSTLNDNNPNTQGNLLQNHHSLSEGTQLDSAGCTSFGLPDSSNNYIGVPLPSYPYNTPGQMYYPNAISSRDNFNNFNTRIVNDGEDLPPYVETFNDSGFYNADDGLSTNVGQPLLYMDPLVVSGGCFMYQNQLHYPPQPFSYGNMNTGGIYIPQMMYPHGYQFASMHPQQIPNSPSGAMGIPHETTFSSAKNEESECYSSSGDT